MTASTLYIVIPVRRLIFSRGTRRHVFVLRQQTTDNCVVVPLLRHTAMHDTRLECALIINYICASDNHFRTMSLAMAE